MVKKNSFASQQLPVACTSWWKTSYKYAPWCIILRILKCWLVENFRDRASSRNFSELVLHRRRVGKIQLVEIGSFAPLGGGNALISFTCNLTVLVILLLSITLLEYLSHHRKFKAFRQYYYPPKVDNSEKKQSWFFWKGRLLVPLGQCILFWKLGSSPFQIFGYVR